MAERFLKQVADLSESDRAIVLHLQEDGRRSFAQIARETRMAEKTVRTRVRHLLDQGIIQITAVTDPRALGYESAALLGITTDPSRPASDIAHALLEITAVDYVVVTTGRFGLFAELICRNRDELQTVIEQEIGRLDGIHTVESFPYLSLHYQLAHFDAARRKDSGETGVVPRALAETDRAIVHALSRDGRAPFQSIADNLEISESQVRTRVNDMIASGVMNVMAIINPMSFAYGSVAWIAMSVDGAKPVRQVADALAGLAHITYVAITAGRFDIFTEVACHSDSELLDLLDSEIRGLPGIAEVEAFLYQHLHYKRLTPIRT
ncbi:MAG: AsnC family transcriptional regulator [Rhodospirillaceae bacterium]|nr:AsnC family transcriptional regulator [Rhodospirillaceae bacterium]|tara:strand:+ start:8785 stop:9750 length:966 start_codon:yes stop_codon:yes gene_type:complete